MPSLVGKVALVIGGARGIGAAVSRRLAHDGASVTIVYRSRMEEANSLADELRATGSDILALQADAGDPAALEGAMAASFAHFGRLDVLVSVAGMAITGPSMPMQTMHSTERSPSTCGHPSSRRERPLR